MHNRHLIVALAVLAACSGTPPVDCRVGADCASGVCKSDGTCMPISVDGGGTGTGGGDGVTGGGAGNEDGGATGGGSAVTGGGMGVTGGGSGVDAGPTCIPNHDGTIERSEVYFQPGLRATFRISGGAQFNTRGTDGGYWDFTTALAGDTSRLVETKAITGEWYAADFPDAGYVTELGAGSDLLAIFSATDDALYLQGVVSPASGSTSTKLKYDPWVKVLQFPLTAGAQWSTDSTVSGTYYTGVYQGVIGATLPFQEEKYEMQVDRAGIAVTPFAEFDVLRVRTTMTRSFPLSVFPNIVIRSFNWNTECFGTVATVSSTQNETNTEFVDAGEVRRLSP